MESSKIQPGQFEKKTNCKINKSESIEIIFEKKEVFIC